jgi:hypothetical protein
MSSRARRKGRPAPRRILGLATCCMRRFNSEASGPRPRREVAGKHGLWHYRTTVTAVASKAGMMLHCGK